VPLGPRIWHRTREPVGPNSKSNTCQSFALWKRSQVSTLGGAHYTASKTGLLGLTRAAAKELGRYGITVNAVCPGMIDTELTREHASPELLERLAASYPVPRLGTSLEVADLICFAASEEAGYITGASFDINGGDLMM